MDQITTQIETDWRLEQKNEAKAKKNQQQQHKNKPCPTSLTDYFFPPLLIFFNKKIVKSDVFLPKFEYKIAKWARKNQYFKVFSSSFGKKMFKKKYFKKIVPTNHFLESLPP